MHSRFSQIEPLEARIAPAVVISNPLGDLPVGQGSTAIDIDLSHLTTTATSSANHTFVTITTNFDTDTVTAGLQAGVITIELYDDLAPITVQNFLRYAETDAFLGTFFHRASSTFVLQGGGYDVSAPGTHIPVYSEIHNEYSASRSNVAGTIAMAKLPGDPNSATSEWFVNLVDNSSILNPQNGGFTVFGVVDATGLTVAKNIASLPKYNQGSDGTGTPVQNYTSGTPTANQLIQITDVDVETRTATDTGITYTVNTLTDMNIDDPTTSVVESAITKAEITGSTLHLEFNTAIGGTAKVKVTASDGSSSATDEFEVNVRPNLIPKIDDGADIIIPSQVRTIGYHFLNNGNVALKGQVEITAKLVLMVKDEATGNFFPSTDPDDVVSSTSFITTLNLPVGANSPTFVSTFTAPSELATSAEQYYQVVVEAATFPSIVKNLFESDLKSQDGAQHQLQNLFGTFGGINYTMKYVAENQPGSPTLTWSMTGGGYGQLSADGKTLSGFNTNAATVTTVNGVGAQHVTLNSIAYASTAGTLNLGNVDLVGGPLIFSSGLKSLTLGDVSAASGQQSLLLIGAGAGTAKAALTFGRVEDLTIESSMPISTLSVKDWTDTSAAVDLITVPSIDAIKARGSAAFRGDFEADVNVQNTVPVASISVAGALRDSIIQAAGNIGAVTVGRIESSKIFAGLGSNPASFADISKDDFDSIATIQSFSILGNKAYAPATNLFVDSQIAASIIGTIKVSQVDVTNGGTDFGFVADVIRSYTRVGTTPSLNLTAPQTVDDQADYLVKIL